MDENYCQYGTDMTFSKGKLAKIAETIRKYQFDALVMVGGFDGYEGMMDLYNNRVTVLLSANNNYYYILMPSNGPSLLLQYPEFNIGLLCMPATISNNCPGSETSIGADTSLNNIVEALDKIKESAVASKVYHSMQMF